MEQLKAILSSKYQAMQIVYYSNFEEYDKKEIKKNGHSMIIQQ